MLLPEKSVTDMFGRLLVEGTDVGLALPELLPEPLPELPLDPPFGGFTLKIKAGDWVMRLDVPVEVV